MTMNAAEPARAVAPHPTLQRFVAGSVLVHAALLFGFVMPERSQPILQPVLTVSIAPRPMLETVAPQRNTELARNLSASVPRLAPTPGVPTMSEAAVPTPASAPAPDMGPIAAAAVNSAPQPSANPAPPPAAPTQPTVTTVAVATAPPAAPERRGKPSTLWLAEYTQAMTTQVARVKNYPQIARLRGWEGTTIVMVQLSRDGAILDARVAESSGHEVLDRQAVSMVRRAEPMPPLPAASAGGSDGPLELRLPIVFALASRD